MIISTYIASLSARRAWIEIARFSASLILRSSLSARRAWIEIVVGRSEGGWLSVALRKESVDRNKACTMIITTYIVALRKESVDRNINRTAKAVVDNSRSPQGERG